MNNKRVLILLTFLLFITSLSSVNAFDLTSAELEKSVCPSSTILFNTNVLGSGSFSVNLEGDAAKWAIVVPQGFVLNNEAKLLYTYITPRFNTDPGIYNLDLVVRNENEVKEVNYKVNIPDCHNLVITGTPSKEICGCNSDTYSFTVSNNGIYQETYQLEVNGKAAPWVSLNQNELSLAPGQTKEISAILNAPCSSDFGENDFTVTVRSLTSNAVASFDSNVIVNSCFDFEAKLDKEFVNMCEHSSETVQVNINNLAQLDNEFELSMTGPAWANLELSKLSLSSQDSGVVNLLLTPDYQVEGDFDVNINVKSSQSKISTDIKTKVSVRKCNDVSFELLQRQDTLCVGSSREYEASVKNIGEFEKEFRIESTEPWIGIDPVILTLGAGESRNVRLNFNPGENITTKAYDISFRATALDSSKVSSEDAFNLDLISREQCFKPELIVKDLEVNADLNAVTPIIIRNLGAQTSTYEIGLSGNANSFSQLNPSTITIEPGKTETIYLYVAPPYDTQQGNYKAEVTLRLKEGDVLDSKVINIKVNEAKQITIQTKNILGKINGLWQRLVDFFKRLVQPPLEEVEEELNQSDVEEELINESGFVNESVEIEEPELETEEPELEPKTELTEESGLIDLDEENTISNDVRFEFNNEIHSLKILSVDNQTVTISIESNITYVLLDKNEDEEVDLDRDGKSDLVLSLQGFDENGSPIIIVNKLEQASESEETNYLQPAKDFLYKYKGILLIGLIIVIGLILFFATGFYKTLIKYIEEEDEDEEPLKIGRYLLIVIILIVLFWYYRAYTDKFNLILAFLNTYKYYIIAGLIILILLILIINYWKQIIDFFEEDNGKRKR